MRNEEILERIMTQHWDMKACDCWVCTAARANGLRPKEQYLYQKQPRVRVSATA
jgi:hypothetical protein